MTRSSSASNTDPSRLAVLRQIAERFELATVFPALRACDALAADIDGVLDVVVLVRRERQQVLHHKLQSIAEVCRTDLHVALHAAERAARDRQRLAAAVFDETTPSAVTQDEVESVTQATVGVRGLPGHHARHVGDRRRTYQDGLRLPQRTDRQVQSVPAD